MRATLSQLLRVEPVDEPAGACERHVPHAARRLVASRPGQPAFLRPRLQGARRAERQRRFPCRPQPLTRLATTRRHATTSDDNGADERQFRVMRDREQWFQVVMGQDAVANLITAESVDATFPLPAAIVETLAFDLSVAGG